MIPARVSLLGVPVAQMTYADALSLIREQVSGTGAACVTVVFANVHVLTEGALKESFRNTLNQADVVLPDGMPLVWAGRLMGSSLRGRCYGPTLMSRALASSPAEVGRHYFYGATPELLQRLGEKVKRCWPDTVIAGMKDAPFGPFDDEVELRNIEAINASGAEILWVGLGCPKQEQWLIRYRSHLKVKVALAVGAAFDFVAGTKPQAPAWMQASGLEWLFRLGSEPRRLWRRYLFRNPYFVIQLGLQWAGWRWRDQGAGKGSG